ncbi:hypothetical protein B9479_006341 [Cryptococcus floricola]|uniref:Uncharacterized protein n=1 Tax=Cryptococcus floricola TaxID=2591691 RepID=A0A5D3AS94_9TREE|nr:hypothetical protein B9479_006341 [Cryptococcus floricola]
MRDITSSISSEPDIAAGQSLLDAQDRDLPPTLNAAAASTNTVACSRPMEPAALTSPPATMSDPDTDPYGVSRGTDFVDSQAGTQRLNRSLKDSLDTLLDGFRAQLAEFALENGVQTTAVERYVFAPRRLPNDWAIFQACDLGKSFTKDYKAKHDGTSTKDAYAAFKEEKGDSLEEVLFESYGETQSRAIGKSGKGSNEVERASLANRMESQLKPIFNHMERQHGLSFVWACVSSNPPDNFSASIMTQNAVTVFAERLKHYNFKRMVQDLSLVLKGSLAEARSREIMMKRKMSSQAENLTVAQKNDIVKEHLLTSYNEALTEASAILSKRYVAKTNIQYQQKALTKQGIKLHLPDGIELDDLARPNSHSILDRLLTAIHKHSIYFSPLPNLEQQAGPPARKRRRRDTLPSAGNDDDRDESSDREGAEASGA